jgi:hypothetical protein
MGWDRIRARERSPERQNAQILFPNWTFSLSRVGEGWGEGGPRTRTQIRIRIRVRPHPFCMR